MQQEKIIVDRSTRIWVIFFGALLFVVCRAVTALIVRLAPETVAVNSGVAFSIPMPTAISLTVSAALILALIVGTYWALKTRNMFYAWSFVVLAVGAASNSIDRIRFGGVVDYIELPLLSTINLADILITIGVSMLALTLLRNAHTYDRTTQDRSNRRN